MRKLSHDSIQAMALKAADQYDDVNDACPYPFGTADGQLFKRIFCEAKEKVKQKQPLPRQPYASSYTNHSKQHPRKIGRASCRERV